MVDEGFEEAANTPLISVLSLSVLFAGGRGNRYLKNSILAGVESVGLNG